MNGDLLTRGVPLKAVIALGFGVTLGLWLLAGYQFTRRISQLEREAVDINRRYSDAQDRLASARGQILLGSVYVRDALLDHSPEALVRYRHQFDRADQAAEQALHDYVPVLDTTEEREHVAQLRREVAEFRGAMLDVFDRRSNLSDAPLELLRTRIMPRRDLLVRVSEEFQALNRRQFIQQQQASAAIYALAQHRVWQQLGAALLVGFGIAVFAARYAGRLEDRLRAQRDREAEDKQHLQRLSARVIKVQEDERRIIARHLHDEVGQVLTAIKFELARAQRTLEQSGAHGALLQRPLAIADSALVTVRDLSRLLHPAMLDDLGLLAAVETQVREFGITHGVAVTLRHQGMTSRLSHPIEVAAYRAVQEALTNVARHAQATCCAVELHRAGRCLTITVEDDGRGFAEDTQKTTTGLGLLGIRERIAPLAGHLDVVSASGMGTRLRIDIPLTSGDAAANEDTISLNEALADHA